MQQIYVKWSGCANYFLLPFAQVYVHRTTEAREYVLDMRRSHGMHSVHWGGALNKFIRFPPNIAMALL